MATIRDVAKLAGVSTATVSRVMNGGRVSAETRARVRQVMDELGYMPAASAVGLARGGSGAVGVLVPEIDNVFYSDILRGITEVAGEKGLPLIFFDTRNDAKSEVKALGTLAQYWVRGAIIGPAADYSEEADNRLLRGTIEKLGIPTVIVDREFENMSCDGVFYENYGSSYRAAGELIKAGNRTLGVITGNLGHKIARDRFEGFQQGARDMGVEIDPRYILHGDFSVERAYSLSMAMFESGDWPEAIFTSNNKTSLGFLRAAFDSGIRVGRDIALIGNDSLKVLDTLGIPFSCVSRDNIEMGRTAARLLSERLSDPSHPRRIVMIPYKLELRGTERRK